ncbi:hypothetical protein BDF19DRAFT_464034 [Syncephalis fuscata]|nr:hypothetical protein BDF19DRAFT_464034 [Syncephalis fuscata]
MLKRTLIITLVAAAFVLSTASATETETKPTASLTQEEVSKWPIKKLKQFLTERDVNCLGCAEKRDFIDTVLENADVPTEEKEEKEAEDEEKETEDESTNDINTEAPKADEEPFKLTDEMYAQIADSLPKDESTANLNKEDIEKIFAMFPRDMAEEMYKGFAEAGNKPQDDKTAAEDLDADADAEKSDDTPVAEADIEKEDEEKEEEEEKEVEDEDEARDEL